MLRPTGESRLNVNRPPARARRSSRWEVHPLSEGLVPFADRWDALNERLFGGHPLLDSAFVGALLRNFGDGRQYLCICRSDGADIAMGIFQPRSGGVWISFVPSQAQIGPVLVADLDLLSGLFAALPGLVNAIELLCVDPRYGGAQLPRALPTAVVRHAVTMSVPLTGKFDDYWGRRSKNLRHNLRRYGRRASESARELTSRVMTSPAEVAAAVSRYAALEGRGWKGQQGTALGSVDSQLSFYRDLMAHHAQRSQALVYELWADDCLAASRLLVAQGGLVVILKTTFDGSLREWAPGRMQLRGVIEDLFERTPGATLDFYTNASLDQLAWADEERTIFHLTVYPDRVRSSAASLLRLAKRFAQNDTVAEVGPATVESVSAETDPANLSGDERALLAACEQRSFALGSEWHDLFSRVVMRGSTGACFHTLRRAGFVKAVVPLNFDDSLAPLGASVGALSNFYSPLYSPALSRDTSAVDLAAVFDAVRAGHGRPPSLTFAPLDPQDRGFAVLRDGLRCAGYAVHDYFAHGNWYLRVQGTFSAYLASRPGALRSTIARMSRRIAAQGGRIEIVTAPDEVPRAAAAYERVYARSWKKAEPVPDFMRELMTWTAGRGWLRLGLVWVADEPVAAQVWIVAHGCAAIYKLAYDAAWGHLAPGTVLSARLMEHAMDVDHVREVDYLVGDDPYKRDWMSHRRERRGLVGYDLTTWTGCWLAAKAAATRWVRARWPATPGPDVRPGEAGTAR